MAKKRRRTANDDYKDFVADQLDGLDGVTFKRMFSGYGVYRDGVFFAIVSGSTLYFKVDDATIGRYVELGMRPFAPTARQTLRTYYEVPADVLDDGETLVEWALDAIAAQQRHR